MMIEFKTQYDRERVPISSGSRFSKGYSAKIMEDGTLDLVESSIVDTYAKIQSYKDSCDIHLILERFVNGDETALSVNTPSFGDFTQYPTTYADMLQRVRDAEDMFIRLPVECRADYNHSASEFFAAIGTDRFRKTYDKYFKVDDVPSEPGVVVTPSESGEVVTPAEPGGVVNE